MQIPSRQQLRNQYNLSCEDLEKAAWQAPLASAPDRGNGWKAASILASNSAEAVSGKVATSNYIANIATLMRKGANEFARAASGSS